MAVLERMKCVNCGEVKTISKAPGTSIEMCHDCQSAVTAKNHEGIFRPDHCPRGYKTCKSLSQIISDGHSSFICCGENDGSDREIEQDKYRVCFKNDATDSLTDNDKRDLMHLASVLMSALAIIEEADSVDYHQL